MVISPVCIVFSQYNTFQSPAGEGEYQKCPPLALWANIAETSFDIGRLSRSAERSKRIFHRKGRKDKMQPFPQRRAFAESGAANAVFLHDPTCEKGVQKRPQAFLNPKIIAVCVFNAQATSANCISQICRFNGHYF
jgi:hypothetical protein